MLTYLLIPTYNSAFDCFSPSAWNVLSMYHLTDGHLIILHHSAPCINLLYFCFIYSFMHLPSLMDYKLPDGRNYLILSISTYPEISTSAWQKKEERKEGCDFKIWSSVCSLIIEFFFKNNLSIYIEEK